MTAYVDQPGHHRHMCHWCAFIWRHHDVNDARHAAGGAHECPACHRCNWSLGIYTGAEPPRVMNGEVPAATHALTSPLNRPDVDEYAEPGDRDMRPGPGPQIVIHPDQAHTFGD